MTKTPTLEKRLAQHGARIQDRRIDHAAGLTWEQLSRVAELAGEAEKAGLIDPLPTLQELRAIEPAPGPIIDQDDNVKPLITAVVLQAITDLDSPDPATRLDSLIGYPAKIFRYGQKRAEFPSLRIRSTRSF